MEAQTAPVPPSMLELEPHARPQERLLREGPHILEPDELLALVLVSGRGTGEDARQLARRVLDELGGLDGLACADAAQLQTLRGIGPARSARIRAAVELGLRVAPFEVASLGDDRAEGDA